MPPLDPARARPTVHCDQIIGRKARIAIIGIDVSPAGAVDLQQIVDLVGGGYFPLTDPNQIQTVVLKALLAVGEA